MTYYFGPILLSVSATNVNLTHYTAAYAGSFPLSEQYALSFNFILPLLLCMGS
jgi:hypothetical protein